jgi:hypothetical protein
MFTRISGVLSSTSLFGDFLDEVVNVETKSHII